MFAMFLVGATILTQGLKVRPRGVEIAVALGVTAVYLLLFLRSYARFRRERTHLMEYGVLGVLIHEALAERVSQGRHVPLPPLAGRPGDGGCWEWSTRAFSGFCPTACSTHRTFCSTCWRVRRR